MLVVSKPSKSATAQRRWTFLLGGILVVVLAMAWVLPFRGKAKIGFGSCRGGDTPFRLEAERAVYAQYVDSASCKECHEEAYHLWAKSSHGLAERGSETQDAVAFEAARTLNQGTPQTSFLQASGQYEVVTNRPPQTLAG